MICLRELCLDRASYERLSISQFYSFHSYSCRPGVVQFIFFPSGSINHYYYGFSHHIASENLQLSSLSTLRFALLFFSWIFLPTTHDYPGID